MTLRVIFAVSLFFTITLATPVKKCSKQACMELADAEELPFSVQDTSNGAPSGCLRYNDGRMIWVVGCSGPQCGTNNCNGCSVMDTLCGAEEAGCDAHATKKGNWCVCQPGFRMNRGDDGKPLGGWPMQYHWNARNTDGFKCIPDEEYMASYLASTCGVEGQSCACEGMVLYGHGGDVAALLDADYVVKTDVTGTVQCTNEEFGDPIWGVRKQCICITGKRCDPSATKQGNWCKCNKHYRMNRNSNGKPYGGWNDRYHFNGAGATVNVCVVDPNNPPSPSKYAHGVKGGNSCPVGYRHIEDSKECLEAGRELKVANWHDASKCLEDNGSGLKPDADCTDCSWPAKQACADGYTMTSWPKKSNSACTDIICTPPAPAGAALPTFDRAPAGSWGWVPPYCSWQSGGDGAIHFNWKASGNNDGGYTPICELAPPTAKPTPAPTSSPTARPSQQPTTVPTTMPSQQPTEQPTQVPSLTPSMSPTASPTSAPTYTHEFTLRGETGEEKVLFLGEVIQLSKPLTVGIDGGYATFAFIGGSSVILEFATAYETHVVMPNFYGSSRCSSTEDERCDEVTDGQIKATGIYLLELIAPSPFESSPSMGSK